MAGAAGSFADKAFFRASMSIASSEFWAELACVGSISMIFSTRYKVRSGDGEIEASKAEERKKERKKERKNNKNKNKTEGEVVSITNDRKLPGLGLGLGIFRPIARVREYLRYLEVPYSTLARSKITYGPSPNDPSILGAEWSTSGQVTREICPADAARIPTSTNSRLQNLESTSSCQLSRNVRLEFDLVQYEITKKSFSFLPYNKGYSI